MLTILMRYKKSGREVLNEASEVHFCRTKGLLFYPREGHSTSIPISEKEEEARDVFVMNDTGQTVARYML